MRRDALVNSTVLIGCGLLVLGLYLVWPPLALIAMGGLLILLGVLLS